MKPICVKDRRFYRPKKTGIAFIEGMPKHGTNVPPGNAAPDRWKPYKLWYGDLWICPDCGHELIIGAGAAAVSEHFKPDFKAQVAACGADIQINDC